MSTSFYNVQFHIMHTHLCLGTYGNSYWMFTAFTVFRDSWWIPRVVGYRVNKDAITATIQVDLIDTLMMTSEVTSYEGRIRQVIVVKGTIYY